MDKKIKTSDIKTELFSDVTITTYGIRFQVFDKNLFHQNKHIDDDINFYVIIVHLLKTGGININTFYNIHLSDEQLNEIVRVNNLLKNLEGI